LVFQVNLVEGLSTPRLGFITPEKNGDLSNPQESKGKGFITPRLNNPIKEE